MAPATSRDSLTAGEWRRGYHRRMRSLLQLSRFRWCRFGPVLLTLAAPLAAPAADDEAALYARFDQVTTAAMQALPTPTGMRSPARIAWFADASDLADLAGLRLRLLDANEATIVEYRIGAETPAMAPHPLGQHPHPGAGEYIVETVVPDAEEGEIRQRLSLSLVGDEQIIRLRAPSDGLREGDPQLRVWAGTGGASIAQRVLDWFGLNEQATRLSLRDNLMEAPDVLHAQQLCRTKAQALTGLRRLQRIANSFEAPPPGIELAQARCALPLGLRAVAADALRAVGTRPVDQGLLAEAVIDLAALDMERGADESAIKVLRALQPMIRVQAYPRFLDRLSLAFLRTGRNVAAGELLAEGPHLSVGQIWDEEGAARPVLAFLLRNLAVARHASGATDQALSVLDIAGERDTRGPLGRALSDHANLVLGSEMLQRRQGSEAAAAFDRINLDGPRAGAALLGRGWAVLLGPSDPLRRERVRGLSRAGIPEAALRAMFKTGAIGCFELLHFTRDVGSCAGSVRFARAQLQADDTRVPEAAMRFWGPLMQRDARDPNVLRAYLAAADAFRVVGNRERARTLLDEGLAQLERSEARLAAASARLARRGAPNAANPLPEEATQAERDLRYWLLDWASGSTAARLAESRALLQRLDSALEKSEQRPALREVAAELAHARSESAKQVLASQLDSLRGLRAEARLGLARLFDRPGP